MRLTNLLRTTVSAAVVGACAVFGAAVLAVAARRRKNLAEASTDTHAV